MFSMTIVDRGNDRYEVTVQADHTTRHMVTCTRIMLDTYGFGTSPEVLLRASFEFLLEREPNTAILSSFELPVIERYFPAYRSVLQQRLAAGGGSRGG